MFLDVHQSQLHYIYEFNFLITFFFFAQFLN